MKKILVVTPLFPSEEKPYYCIYLLQLFEALKKRGYHVDILMPDRALADGAAEKNMYRGFELIHVGHNCRMPHEVFGRMSRGFLRSVANILKTVKPDLIDLNLCGAATGRSMIALAKKHRIPTVMHYHGLNVFYPYQTSHPLLEKVMAHNKAWIADHVDGIVGVSNKVGDIVRNGSQNPAVYTVYNGVDMACFYPAEQKRNEVFTIICVANLIPIKGHAFLLRAVHNVMTEYGYDIGLQIVGDGPEKDRLRALATELGIADAVEFCGELHYDIVAQKVRAADFFIMPSYFESLGCVYLEAMASQVAAMGVRGCGIDEVIEDRVNGYLVDPRNDRQIAEGIRYAIAHPQEHKQIALRGYETVMNSFQWKHVAAELDRVYRELWNRRTENA